MTITITHIRKWAENQIKEYSDAETFSRNGEPVDYEYGVFAGRVESAKELLAEIRKTQEKIQKVRKKE